MEKSEALRGIRYFVLDLDGTVYLGDRLLEGTLPFLEAVRRAGRDFLFFTNNSTRACPEYREKLARLGCPSDERHILTSGDVAARFLRDERPGASAYVMGTEALRRCFASYGVPLTEDRPDAVVVGFDTESTYRKLERACTFIRQGAEFFATHRDVNCPTEGGFMPDCGFFCAAIALATGREPRVLGKPHAETARLISRLSGVPLSQIAFVGDSIPSDVAAGVRNGARGILVLSGATRAEDVAASPIVPDAVFRGLGEMAEYL